MKFNNFTFKIILLLMVGRLSYMPNPIQII